MNAEDLRRVKEWRMPPYISPANLYDRLPAPDGVVYYWDMDNIGRRFLACAGGKKHGRKLLSFETEDVFEMYSIDPPRDADGDYVVVLGEFVSLDWMLSKWGGLGVAHEIPTWDMRGFLDDGEVSAAVLKVTYKGRADPTVDTTLLYALFQTFRISLGLCFGRC